MKNKLKFFLCLSTLFILNSCSMGFYFYVQNFTNEDKKIILTFSKDINSREIQDELELVSSKATQIKDFKKATDKIKLNYNIEDKNKITIILPKNSLTNIDMVINHSTNVTGIEYTKNKTTIQLSSEQLMMMTKSDGVNRVFELD